MVIYFITGNKDKFSEAKSILEDLEQLNVDLPEIQEIDAKKIIQHKLLTALNNYPDKEFIVEDTSLYINSLNGLPGPLIKWFLKSIGDHGVSKLVSEENEAEGRTLIGYAKNKDEIYFFEGSIKGKIVNPRGEKES